MDDAWDVAAQRQEKIEPEMQAKANLKKHADRRQENGKKNANNVHD